MEMGKTGSSFDTNKNHQPQGRQLTNFERLVSEGLSPRQLIYATAGFFGSVFALTWLLNLFLPQLSHSTFLLSVLIVLAFTMGLVVSRVYDEWVEPFLILRNLRKARREVGLDPKAED